MEQVQGSRADMLAVRFCIRNKNGLLMFCQKRMRDYLLKPCDEKIFCPYSKIFTGIFVMYSTCIDKNQEDIKYLAAFDHGIGRKQKGICAKFIMGKLVDKLNVPTYGGVSGWCFTYKTRDQVMALVARYGQYRHTYRHRKRRLKELKGLI